MTSTIQGAVMTPSVMTIRRAACLLGAALVLSASAGVRGQSGPTYTILTWPRTPDNSYGATLSTPRAVNASGDGAGAVSFAGQGEDDRAFLWQNGVIRYLPPLQGSYSGASAINDSGQIVGYASTAGDITYRAVLWENGVISDLGTLGGNFGSAYGINASGQVVGVASTAGDASYRAFVWENGVMRDLGTLGGNQSRASGINTSGQVVGAAQTSTASHAFLWQNGVMSDLGTLGGASSAASAINVLGQVVGSAQTSSNADHAFLWRDGVMSDLGTFGGNHSVAYAINASGQVVGYAQTPGNAVRAFLWQGGVMTDLNALLPPGSSWVLVEATAINDSGAIVGWGYFNNQIRAYTLTPVTTAVPSAPIAVPGQIEAENFDQGGAGVAYADLTPGNSGGAYRTEEDVDIERVEGSATAFNVGWMGAGEWLRYTIDVGATGSYTVEAKVASYGDGGTFHLEFNGTRSGSIHIPATGGWQQWQTVATTVTLAAGAQQLRVVLDTNGSSGAVGNLDYLRITRASDPSPNPVGFTVEARDFATGGQGCWEGPFQCGGAYYDETPGNWGDAQVRPGTDVDLWYDDGGIVIGGLDGLEWVTFRVNVPQSGQYKVTFRTASPVDRPADSGLINVGIHGVDGSWVGNQPVPATGGPGEWHSYVTWNASRTIHLPAGQQTLTMWATGGWYNVRNMQFTLDADDGGAVPFQLTGIVAADDGTVVPGARIYVSFFGSPSEASAVTDAFGVYKVDFTAVPGAMHGPAGTADAMAFAWVTGPDCPVTGIPSACGYESDFRYIVSTTQQVVQNFRLHRIARISAGESVVVTVSEDDAICDNNSQDMHPWGDEFLCRTVRVVAPSDGIMNVEAIPVQAGASLPGLEVETLYGFGVCCSERMGNPTSLLVTAGVEVMVNVEVPWGMTGRQSFVVKTSMSPR